MIYIDYPQINKMKTFREHYKYIYHNKEHRDNLVALSSFLQLFFVFGIFLCIFVVSIYIVSFGLGVKVYLDSAELKPDRVGKAMNQTFSIIANVDEISHNVVPVSVEAKNVLVNGTNATIVSDAISRTYEGFSGVHKLDWKYLVANFTSVLASVAHVNHSSVTNLLSDMHSPQMQETIRSRVDNAIKTVDAAGMGAYDIFNTFKMAMTFNSTRV
jgi:hypothetical protein